MPSEPLVRKTPFMDSKGCTKASANMLSCVSKVSKRRTMKKLMLMTCASALMGLMAVAETETVNGVEWYYEIGRAHV